MVAASSSTRCYYAFEYVIEGDLRFLAHQDEMQLLLRATTRAAWPLAYSEGFNPQPKLNIPLPRSVGVLSSAQLAVLQLTEPVPLEALHTRLTASMPNGSRLRSVFGPLPSRKMHSSTVSYRVALSETDAAICRTRVAALLQCDELIIERNFGPDKPTRMIDIRPFVRELHLYPDGLWMRLDLDNQQTARPDEILIALGCDVAAQNHRICRETVTWLPDLESVAAWPPRERNSVGKEGNNHQEEDGPEDQEDQQG